VTLLRKLLPTSDLEPGAARNDAPLSNEKRPGARSFDVEELRRLVTEADQHGAAGRHTEALRFANRALEMVPDDAELVSARASTLFAWGRYHEALPCFLRAQALGLDTADFNIQLASAFSAMGRIEEAEACMRKAIALEPDSFPARFGLAAALQAQKKAREAIAAYERALELRPDSIVCLDGLGNCSIELNDSVAAETYARRAMALNDRRYETWGNLGVAFDRQQRAAEALAAFEQAARLDPKTRGGRSDTFYNLAVGLSDSGRVGEAISLLESNLAERPNVFAYHGYSLALLTVGRLLEGWNVHDYRWAREPYLSLRPKFQRPLWDGQGLKGKTILLLNEQGLGDTIQFLRYAPYLKNAGATVVVRCQDGLFNLASRFRGVDGVVARGGAHVAFDTYIHVMSLANVFGTDLASIPAEVPYLDLEPGSVERWSERIRGDAALKVGLVWAGSPDHPRDRYRSVSLQMLAPVLNVKGVRFFLLQKGKAAAEATSIEPDIDMVNLGAELEDLTDAAAAINELDLLICVDTSLAHLAGALGKPVWVLLPKPADWRWLLDREDSPWYPTMRLFRQSRRADWSDVIDRLAKALNERVAGHVAASAIPRRSSSISPRPREPSLPHLRPGHRPGFSAVAECRSGIVQYLPDEAPIGSSLGWYGEFLQLQLDLLAGMIRPGSTVLEVGAGVGAHALPLATALGPDGHLILYESRPVVRRLLQQNFSANELRNITLMRRLLGGKSGFAAGAERTNEGAPAPEDSIIETVDDLQLEQLHLLKVDEGTDATSVIDGASETMWRLRPTVFLAAQDDGALGQLTRLAKDRAYRCWKVETPMFNPDNFNRRQDDTFDGRRALALLALPEEGEVAVPLDRYVEL
jgi:FkbM family methyltransferase